MVDVACLMDTGRSPTGQSSDDTSPRKPVRDFLAGQILIATPNMADPRFERSVILICAHDEAHAMGIVVNKPISDLPMRQLLEQLGISPDSAVGERFVYFGGPVQTERGLVLHSLDYRTDVTLEIGGGVGITGSRDILVDIAGKTPSQPPPENYFLAIGYAGWSAGQLEEELSMNAWVHCDQDMDILFAKDASKSWEKSLAKLGVTGAMLSPEWAAPRSGDAPLN